MPGVGLGVEAALFSLLWISRPCLPQSGPCRSGLMRAATDLGNGGGNSHGFCHPGKAACLAVERGARTDTPTPGPVPLC